MIAFEITKNGSLLGTVESGRKGLLMATAQCLRSIDEQGGAHEHAVLKKLPG